MTKKITKTSKALVLLSGGQDSTTCLAWALERYQEVYAIGFNYDQKHKTELKSAKKIAKITNTPLTIIPLSLFKTLTKNALTDKTIPIKKGTKSQLPTTFVDGRNLIFLSIAAIYAKSLGIHELITGVCQTDFSGYPDCRDQFIKSLQKTLTLSMDYEFQILTPLMWLTKAETVKLMQKLGRVDLLAHSHTCYEGLRPPCGQCPACLLRKKGFKEAGIKDPININ